MLRDLGLDIVALYAAKGQGKTHFFRYDCMPAFMESGYLCIHANFEGRDQPPILTLTKAVEDALKKTSIISIQTDNLSPLNLFDFLVDLFDRVNIVFILDELQEISVEPKNSSFMHSLRSLIINASKMSKKKITCVFIGSDENTMKAMFDSEDKPFYLAAFVDHFELLGREFTDALIEQHQDMLGKLIDKTKAYEMFCDVDFMPKLLLERMEELGSI